MTTDSKKLFCCECKMPIPTDGMVMYINKEPICNKCSKYIKILPTESITPQYKSLNQIREVVRIVNSTSESDYKNGVFEALMWVIGEIPDEDFAPLQKSKDF